MGTSYSHLSLEERCRLRGMMEMGLSLSEMARRLGRHRSTVRRELARNRSADGGYRPDSAARRAWARKLRGSRIDALHPPARPRRGPPCHGMVSRSRSRGGWSSTDRSTGSARSRSTATPTARSAGARGCRGCSRSASASAGAGGATDGASRPSPTGRRSTSVRQRPIFAASSATGKATSCTSAASATSS
jgi:hypothetical protein